MTGLLQRLGARATGTAWAVRSDARLPFGAERMAQLPAPAAPAAPPARAPQQPGAEAEHMAAAPPMADAVPARHAPATNMQATGTPTTGQQAMDRRPDIASAVRATVAQPQPPAALLPDTAAPPLARPQAHDAPAPKRAQPAATAPAAPRAHTAGTAPPDLPEPLLPAMAGSPAAPSHALRAALPLAIGQQRSPAAAPQETEVHIHIGRIDVTALHEAPRPKARPRERAQPMSLDAYLAKRGSAT